MLLQCFLDEHKNDSQVCEGTKDIFSMMKFYLIIPVIFMFQLTETNHSAEIITTNNIILNIYLFCHKIYIC